MRTKSLFAAVLFSLIARTLFAQNGLLPTIDDTLLLDEWLVVGPFSAGSRERSIDFLIEHGGERNIAPYQGLSHISMTATGGVVEWKKVRAEDGKVEMAYENVDCDNLQDIFGWPGLMGVGYADAEFENEGRRRALAVAEKVGWFYLNGRQWPGDRYGHDFMRVPIVLKDGKTRLLAKIGGAGDRWFTFKILPADAPAMILAKDVTGRLAVGDGEIFERTGRVVSQIAPLALVKFPVRMELHGAGVEARGQVDGYAQKGWAFVVADLFAALAPSAGWPRFQLYVPFTWPSLPI
ncbi:MAG: hypothetical protein ACE5OR_07435 [bacterium]